ncbi:MAG: hypothetical protein HRT68_14000, partial [Flavobacteriaceae bacterium]|nr:hypothetical protein [Flavobacteriaceae bacterium]
MLKAGAMAYAIIISLVLGLFLGMFLLLQSNSRLLQERSFIAGELLTTHSSATDYFLKDFGTNLNNSSKAIDVLSNGIYSTGKMKNWGVYKVGIVSTFFKNDSITKAYLLGEKQVDDNLALYLTDYDKPLNMVGLATIKGDAKLPRSGIKRGNISNVGKRAPVLLDGTRLVSSKTLPRLKEEVFFEEQTIDKKIAEFSEQKTVTNPFTKTTLKIDSTGRPVISNMTLEGNIVLKSLDTLIIKNSNTIENIVIDAPVVIFEEGFSGNAQVYASKRIELRKNSVLKYPSSLFIDGDEDELMEINIGENSQVLGGV